MDTALVFVHVTGGTVALITGGIAMLVRKGETVHRYAGSVFFVAMLTMTISAFVVAVIRDQSINISASTVTFYMIVTSWVAATRKDGEIGRFETAALLLGLGVTASAFLFALRGGDVQVVHYVFGSIAAIGVLSDVNVLARGGLSGRQRIARHLWRMSFAMLVATGAYFAGQPRFVPAILRETNLNFLPIVLVLVLLMFWLVRVRFTRWWSETPPVL
jgi:uncharacterized membrane protein